MEPVPESAALAVALEAIANLGRIDQELVYRKLKETLYPNETFLEAMVQEVRERRFKGGVSCPHCSSPETYRNGKSKGKQRYVCRACCRSFGDFTNTPISRTRYPELWMKHFRLLINGASLKKVSEELGIHISTAFYWRHKALNGLRHLPPDQLSGVTEVDEAYFLESRKGMKGIVHREPRKRGGAASKRGISNEQVCVLVGRDRDKNTQARVVGWGQMSNKRAEITLSECAGGVTALCTDSASAYRNFAKNHEIPHYAMNTSKRVRTIKGIYHIQNVNSYHSRLRKWMERFNGVSTKHMNNYLEWFHFIDDHGTQALRPKVAEFLVASSEKPVVQTFRSIKATPLNVPDS